MSQNMQTRKEGGKTRKEGIRRKRMGGGEGKKEEEDENDRVVWQVYTREPW